VPETTDELTPNRLDDPNVDLLEPAVMLDDRVAELIVPLRLFPPTAGRAPADADPVFRENVDVAVDPRFPAAVFPVPRLPVFPVLPEFRADIDEPERPCAAPAADLPPFAP
jgi:hypothetical protein